MVAASQRGDPLLLLLTVVAIAALCFSGPIARGLATLYSPSTETTASLLKRWLLGTHQGAVSREHLDYYLDEVTFRFNRRGAGHRGLLFYRLLEQAATTTPQPTAPSSAKPPRERRRQAAFAWFRGRQVDSPHVRFTAQHSK